MSGKENHLDLPPVPENRITNIRCCGCGCGMFLLPLALGSLVAGECLRRNFGSQTTTPLLVESIRKMFFKS